MPLEPWRFMTRTDIEAMWRENAYLRETVNFRSDWLRKSRRWLWVMVALTAANIALAVLAVLR